MLDEYARPCVALIIVSLLPAFCRLPARRQDSLPLRAPKLRFPVYCAIETWSFVFVSSLRHVERVLCHRFNTLGAPENPIANYQWPENWNWQSFRVRHTSVPVVSNYFEVLVTFRGAIVTLSPNSDKCSSTRNAQCNVPCTVCNWSNDLNSYKPKGQCGLVLDKALQPL